jgi:hypothetical protein
MWSPGSLVLNQCNGEKNMLMETKSRSPQNTDSQYKGAYAVFFKEKINLVMRNSNNRF